jgi:hypothetical protein
MNIYSVCDALVKTYGCALHSDIVSQPADIDFYVPPSSSQAVADFVHEQGFILTGCNPFQRVFRRFENNGTLYILDLLSGFDVYLEGVNVLQLSPLGNIRIGASQRLHKCFKYLCLQAQDKVDYLAANRGELTDFLCDSTNFLWISSTVVDATRGSAQSLLVAMRRPVQHWRWLGSLAAHTWRKSLLGRVKRLGTGVSLAFVGPDGSGKSFIIERMRAVGETRVIYMGDWFFALQGVYNQMLRIPSPWNRFVYFIYPLENYFRYFKVVIWKLLGRIVLIDRFPGTNRNIVQRGLLGRLNSLTYKVFPKPDLIVLLHAPPEVVFSRKQELTVDEIADIQYELRVALSKSRHLILDTEDLDRSLNRLLTEIYG